MNKAEINKHLESFAVRFNLMKSDITLVAGTALVYAGVREETADVDLYLDTKVCRRLQQTDGFKLLPVPENPRVLWLTNGVFDIRDQGFAAVQSRDGYWVQTLDSLLTMKQDMNRSKDQDDIYALKQILVNR